MSLTAASRAPLAALLAGLCGSALAQAPALPIWPPEHDRDRFFDPPPALPQDIHGVVRASMPVQPLGRIDRIRDVFPAVRACWDPDGAGAAQITVRLGFRRDGTIMGAPRVTYAKAPSLQSQQAFAERVLAALHGCAPLPFSPAFGGAVAGRPFTFRFIDDRNF